jgi:hypothetical protein
MYGAVEAIEDLEDALVRLDNGRDGVSVVWLPDPDGAAPRSPPDSLLRVLFPRRAGRHPASFREPHRYDEPASR